ncbi:PIG-L family deacetylase [Hymenobacter sp. GOD-10R]|uniref:PIG-L family deacetylase n=1 Tax=Hymenobacter sp. GOD-10R TaxID=3093922 RepID=UPI002D77B367|nr:PIG-L family deacetylase [Hymenobacter sp. GOD-10R]WRQ28326.1 PIG-L family deacetylase [Hymenobacter sp. GOD-10R]
MVKSLLLSFVFSVVLGLSWGQLAQAQSVATKEVNVYVVAHQDDWQLFMGSHAYNNVQKGGKVVFVCLTAGQADKPGDQYWKGREAGCKAATRTAADATSAPAASAQVEDVVVNKHSLQVYRYKNTSSYFLRLPDGGLDAKGFAQGNFQSLFKCKGNGTAIKDITGSVTYTNWTDLVKTVHQLILQETDPNSKLVMHYPDPIKKKMDHPDHTMAGVLAQAATSDIECRQQLYLGYITQTKPLNLTDVQTANQTLLFKANCEELMQNGLASEWDDKHRVWLGRQYFRIRHNAPTPPGSQPMQPVAALPAPIVVVAPTSTVPTNGEIRQISTLDTMMVIQQADLLLRPTYPNPFDVSTLIGYQLPKSSFVSVRIFDLQGRLVQTLVNQKQTPGNYELWIDVNEFPAAGVYLCQLQAGRESRSQRIQIVH